MSLVLTLKHLAPDTGLLSIPSDATLTLAFVLIFYTIMYTLRIFRGEILEKHGISVEGITIMFRTKSLNRFIMHIGQRWSKAWKVFFTIGIVISVYLMCQGILYLHQNLYMLLRGTGGTPVQLVIPGITIGLNALPYMIIAFLVTLIPHELFHGFAASAEGIKVKSSGLFVFLVFFGGFVEPDEDALEKSRLLTKARVYAAGSYANYLTFLLISLLLPYAAVSAGIVVKSTLPGYPAEHQLKPGDVIWSINGTRISSISDLDRFMSRTRPGDLILMNVSRGGEQLLIRLKLAPSPYNSSRGFMGIVLSNYYKNEKLVNLLYWVYWITISVAVINMLPIFILDGGRIVAYALQRVLGEKRYKIVYTAISCYMLAILILNLAASTAIWGVRIKWLP